MRENRDARSTQPVLYNFKIDSSIYLHRCTHVYVPVAPSYLVCPAVEAETVVVVVMIMMLVAMKRGMDEKRVEPQQRFLDHCGCNVTMLLLVQVPE